MQFYSFDVFEKELSRMPAGAILKSLALDCKLLEEDLETYRRAFTEEQYSILCFRQFMRSAQRQKTAPYLHCLPPDHIELYKQTIVRLIQAEELDRSAMQLFDRAFIAATYV